MEKNELYQKAEKDLSLLIQCKTVSYYEHEKEDTREFEKFHSLLKERFPLVFKHAKEFRVGRNGVFFYLSRSENTSEKLENQNASVLMSHYDVVPAEGEDWIEEPFSGKIDDTAIWGRGTLDTKATLCAIMASAEAKLALDWKPKKDLYLAFSGEEETSGQSCPDMVSWLKEKNISVDFVLDEGGAIIEGSLPGLQKPAALIGIAEKGTVNIDCSIQLFGGHASAPQKHSTAGFISQAVCEIEKSSFKAKLSKPVYEMFRAIAPHCAQPYKFVFKNAKLFSPLLKLFSPYLGAEFNAMMRTTCAVTKLQGSPAYNVIPPLSSLGLNLRLMEGETIETAEKWIKKRFRKVEKLLQKKHSTKDAKISITVPSGSNPSRISDVNCEQWEMLSKHITQTWPNVCVSPYLMMAASDSRHYGEISDKVYRFSPMPMSKEERAMIHGKNERIQRKNFYKTLDFYMSLMDDL